MRCLSNWLNSYMEYSATSEAPKDFIFWSGLWVLSAAVGRKAWMRFTYGYVYPNLWIVLVGPPATYKSTVCEMADGFIEGIQGIHPGPDMTTIEALIKHLPLTQESFVYKGEELTHQSMAITVPEWSNIIGEKDLIKCNLLCRLYDAAKKFDKWTTTQGCVSLRNYCIAKLAGSTNTQIVRCLPAAAIGSGLTSRYIFIIGDPIMDEDLLDPLSEVTIEREALKKNLREDVEYISKKLIGQFEMSSEAKEFYVDWYKKNKRGKNRIITDANFDYYYNRKPQFVQKVAMLLNISYSDSMMIDLKDIQKAIKLLGRAEFRMPEAFSGFGMNPVAPAIDAIREVFRQDKTKELTFKRLGLRIWKNVGETQLKEAVRTMSVYGLAKVSKDGKSLILLEGV